MAPRMEKTRGKVLIVDDDRDLCDLLEKGLRVRRFQASSTTSAEEGLRAVETGEYDVVLTDLNMQGMNGLELCRAIAARRPDVLVIVITGFGSLETAIDAIHNGAYDFVSKPFELEFLDLTLDRAIRHRALLVEAARLRAEVELLRKRLAENGIEDQG